ncbi:topB [Symbiodinium sp. CCMP2592]|nr:topB [Symbiodinium sp. CCMP2592]
MASVGVPVAEVTALQLDATHWYQNVKANPSKGKMAKAYTATLKLANGGSLTDVVEYRASGQGRNCYFFTNHRLVLKIFVDPSEQWGAHESEERGLQLWQPRLPKHIPAFFGRFIVNAQTHSGFQRADAILVGKAGPTLESVLEGIDGSDSESMRQKVRQHFFLLVSACKNAFDAGLRFYPDMHPRNVCLDETLEQYMFVDLDTLLDVEPHLTFADCMRKANKFLTKQASFPQGPAFAAFKQLANTCIDENWGRMSDLTWLHSQLELPDRYPPAAPSDPPAPLPPAAFPNVQTQEPPPAPAVETAWDEPSASAADPYRRSSTSATVSAPDVSATASGAPDRHASLEPPSAAISNPSQEQRFVQLLAATAEKLEVPAGTMAEVTRRDDVKEMLYVRLAEAAAPQVTRPTNEVPEGKRPAVPTSSSGGANVPVPMAGLVERGQKQKRPRLMMRRNKTAKQVSEPELPPSTSNELPCSLSVCEPENAAGHYSLLWNELVTVSKQQETSHIIDGSVKIVLSVRSGTKADGCNWPGLDLRASVTCCCPGGGKLTPDQALQRQSLFESTLSNIALHCCPQPLCGCHTNDDFFLRDADRLSEDTYQHLSDNWRDHLLRARLEQAFDVELPLQRNSALPYSTVFRDAEGNSFIFQPTESSRPRAAHLEGGQAWGGLNLSPPDFHSMFWILALLHEQLTARYWEVKRRLPPGAHSALSRDRRKVEDPVALVRQLEAFMQAQIQINKTHQHGTNLFSFQDLLPGDLNLLKLSVDAVQAAAFVLPNVSYLAYVSAEQR